MKINKNLHQKKIKENLINEFKGNLFEFVVGLKVAKLFHLEAEYYLQLEKDYRLKLMEYENFLRLHDLHLLQQLNFLADKVVVDLEKIFKGKKIKRILLLGEMREDVLDKGEADLIFESLSGEKIYLSLKLCKKNAYVNTKNAGAKSFFARYFEAIMPQAEFNHHLEACHEHFLNQLDQQYPWRENETYLPGDLPDECKEVLEDYYNQLANKIYQLMQKIFNQAPHIFQNGIQKLLGFTRDDLIQLICHYEGAYEWSENLIHRSDDFGRQVSFELLPVKEKCSFMLVKIPHYGHLQIRVKPMNRFDGPSPKINCSVFFIA